MPTTTKPPVYTYKAPIRGQDVTVRRFSPGPRRYDWNRYTAQPRDWAMMEMLDLLEAYADTLEELAARARQ
jgi:hypothetical protein